MKKLMAFLLSAVVFAGVLTGCGGRSAQNIQTIRVWTSNSHSFGKELDFINNYNKTEGKGKGIYIDYVLKAYNLYEELDKATMTNDLPEFSSWADFNSRAQSGGLVAIDDLPGGKEILREHVEKGLQYAPYTEYDGKIYSLPIGISTQGLIYNKDMFKKAGIVDENGEALPPQTLEEMCVYAKKLTDAKNGEYGIIFPMRWDNVKDYKGGDSNELWFTQDILSLAVASIGAEAYKDTKGLGQTFLPYMKMVLNMRDDGSIYPGAEDMTNETARAIFSGGGIGMKMSSTFDVGVFNYQFPFKDDWGVAPVPVLYKGERHKQVGSFSCTNMINSTAIKNVEPKKLTEVLKLFMSEEYKLMLYEEGLQIPYGFDLSAMSIEDVPKGWAEFKQLAENTENIEGGLLASGERLPQIFVNGVYLANKDLYSEVSKHDQNVYKEWITAEEKSN